MIFVLVFILSLILQIFLPWYVIAPVAFMVALWKAQSAGGAFWQAFLSLALLWGGYAAYIHFQSERLLSIKLAPLFFLPAPELLIVVTMLIGGLVAGLAALAGYYAKAVFFAPKERTYKR